MPVGITTNVTCGLGKSKSKGQPGNLAHNRREFDPYNTDPDLAVNNIFFVNRSLEETYEVAFGDSIDKYISTQKRKDRISYTRHNYFRYLFGVDPNSVEANAVLMSNKRGKNSVKSFNEMVVQIGDCKEFGNFMRDEYDNFIDKNGNKVKWDKSARNYYDIDGNVVANSKTLIANPKAEKARDMLEIYYKGGRYNRVGNGINQRLNKVDDPSAEADFELPSFEERNPNFAIACSVMHNDEWHGTPHLHIDFVPIGEGYKKGPEKQLGFERALACMGYTDRITAFYEWRDKERQILKDICNCYGIETKTKAQEQADYRGETLPVDVYSNAMRDAKADAEVIKESAKIAAKHIRKEAEFQADKMRTQAREALDTANSKAREITAAAENEAEILRSENKQLTEKNDTLREDNESYSKKNEDLGKQITLKSGLIAIPKKSLLGFRKNVVVNADEVEQLNEIHSTISRLSNNTLTSDEDRKAAESERQEAEQLRQNQEQLIQQEAERITREAVRKSQRERREYEKKREECEKIKAECEKIKRNLGRIIKHRSIELLKMTFPEIEQEKLASKIKKLDETARQDFMMNPGNEDKQY